jgi:hypothetical protein
LPRQLYFPRHFSDVRHFFSRLRRQLDSLADISRPSFRRLRHASFHVTLRSFAGRYFAWFSPADCQRTSSSLINILQRTAVVIVFSARFFAGRRLIFISFFASSVAYKATLPRRQRHAHRRAMFAGWLRDARQFFA